MQRAYYSAPSDQFLIDHEYQILGELTDHHPFALDDLQKNAWKTQIQILKNGISLLGEAFIALEYAIPRMGKRVDAIVLFQGIVFVLEFKVGEHSYTKYAIEQVIDYSLDLKNFHAASHSLDIVPVLVATGAPKSEIICSRFDDGVYRPLKVNAQSLVAAIRHIINTAAPKLPIDPRQWLDSVYKPTPTIIEAAQALYRGHDVKEISRSDSGAINLSATSDAIAKVIDNSKANKRKSICFLTGVPGAGKTLAGLNIANERHNIDKGEHAVFLSGNGPLVLVLQEALARDDVARAKREGVNFTKKKALSSAMAFIQNIHHFRDDNLITDKPPVERVAVFDEAQRAWTLDQTKSFMARKKGIPDFEMSEPEFLISVLDRHVDWAIIICLIGGGQEINTGEAGLHEWFQSIHRDYPNWDVYVSNKLSDKEYTSGIDIYSELRPEQITIENDLHLAVSVRSFRSERVSEFVKAILDLDVLNAKQLYKELKSNYPIVITRHLSAAKQWLRARARGSEDIGIIASSGAHRLKPYGIHIKSEIDPRIWFLNDDTDIRSAGFLEEVATEFEIQGLELDWACVAWDANLRIENGAWGYKNFKGAKWQNVNGTMRRRYLLNAYRVLLTRARQGMVIFIPDGDSNDDTRLPSFYDPLFNYLCKIGIERI